jgi:hypothetical protein
VPLNKRLRYAGNESGTANSFSTYVHHQRKTAALLAMAALSGIAIELLLDVFQRFDNIDDVLHLARCSKHLYTVFDTYRFQILKSVIVSATLLTAMAICYTNRSEDV